MNSRWFKGGNPSFTEALHIYGLFSFALTQPLLDVLSRSPEYFVAHKATGLDLALLLLLLVVIIPGIAVLALWLIGRVSQRLRRLALLAGLCLLVAAIFNPPLKTLPDWLNGLRALTALAAGAGATWAYARWKNVRAFTTWLALSVPIFPLVFLFYSPVLESVGGEYRDFSAGRNVIREESSSKPPVVFIVFDELPVVSLMDENRKIDARRYPSFAALANEATWYRNATAVANNSTFSLPSILTGNYPDAGRIPVVRHYPDNLFTFLGQSYDLKVVETAAQMCPPELQSPEFRQESILGRQTALLVDTGLVALHIVMPDKIANRLPEITNTWNGFGDPHKWLVLKWLQALSSDRPGTWKRFTDAVAKGDKAPVLYFIHILLPHTPFQFLPSGQEYSLKVGLPVGEQVWEDEAESLVCYYRHLLQLGFVDRLLGNLLARMKETGVYDSSVLVLLADHGISFRLGQKPRGLTAEGLSDVVSVPLLLKRPYQATGEIIDVDVELIDVLPTVLDILDVSPQWQIRGRSAQAPNRLCREEKRVLEGGLRTWVEYRIDHEAKYKSLAKKLEWFGTGADSKGFFFPRKRNEKLARFAHWVRQKEAAF